MIRPSPNIRVPSLTPANHDMPNGTNNSRATTYDHQPTTNSSSLTRPIGGALSAEEKREDILHSRELAVRERESAIRERESAVREREGAVHEREKAAEKRDNVAERRDAEHREREADLRWREEAELRRRQDQLRETTSTLPADAPDEKKPLRRRYLLQITQKEVV